MAGKSRDVTIETWVNMGRGQMTFPRAWDWSVVGHGRNVALPNSPVSSTAQSQSDWCSCLQVPLLANWYRPVTHQRRISLPRKGDPTLTPTPPRLLLFCFLPKLMFDFIFFCVCVYQEAVDILGDEYWYTSERWQAGPQTAAIKLMLQ